MKRGDLIWGELCCVLSRGRKGVKSSAWRGMGVESSHIATPQPPTPPLVVPLWWVRWGRSGSSPPFLPPSLPRYSLGASWVPGVKDTTGKKHNKFLISCVLVGTDSRHREVRAEKRCQQSRVGWGLCFWGRCWALNWVVGAGFTEKVMGRRQQT